MRAGGGGRGRRGRAPEPKFLPVALARLLRRVVVEARPGGALGAAGGYLRGRGGMGCSAGPGWPERARGLGPGAAAGRPGKRERRRPAADGHFAGDPLGLVTHFIPVTTRARLELRPMGRRGGQLLRGTPALPRAAFRGPSGGRRRRGWFRRALGPRGARAAGSPRTAAPALLPRAPAPRQHRGRLLSISLHGPRSCSPAGPGAADPSRPPVFFAGVEVVLRIESRILTDKRPGL